MLSCAVENSPRTLPLAERTLPFCGYLLSLYRRMPIGARPERRIGEDSAFLNISPFFPPQHLRKPCVELPYLVLLLPPCLTGPFLHVLFSIPRTEPFPTIKSWYVPRPWSALFSSPARITSPSPFLNAKVSLDALCPRRTLLLLF